MSKYEKTNVALAEYTKASMSLIRSDIKTCQDVEDRREIPIHYDHIRLNHSYMPQFLQFGQIMYGSVLQIDPSPVVDALHHKLALLPEYSKLVWALADEELTPRPEAEDVPIPRALGKQEPCPEFRWAISRFTTHYLKTYYQKRQPSLSGNAYHCPLPDFDTAVLEQAAKEFIEYQSSPTIPFAALCPLGGFWTDEESISLSSSLRIRKLDERDKQAIWRRKEYFAPADQEGFDVARITHGVEMDLQIVPTELHGDHQDRLHPIFKAVSSLRLICNTNVNVTAVLLIPRTPLYEPINIGHVYYPSPWQRGGFPQINNRRLQELKSLWDVFPEKGKRKAFDLALDRLQAAERDSSAKECLIDYWIALEALFLRNEGELRYRASTRLAYLLGNTPEERLEIAKNVKDSYDWRSYVVHGESRKESPSGDIDTACRVAGSILRRALLKITPRLQAQNVNSIIAEIDKAVLAGVPLPEHA